MTERKKKEVEGERHMKEKKEKNLCKKDIFSIKSTMSLYSVKGWVNYISLKIKVNLDQDSYFGEKNTWSYLIHHLISISLGFVRYQATKDVKRLEIAPFTHKFLA